jgi:hypothetical protein
MSQVLSRRLNAFPAEDRHSPRLGSFALYQGKRSGRNRVIALG